VSLEGSQAVPGEVLETTKQTGEAPPRNWEWVERSVWTDRMLEALEQGVKGGVWFSLIDKVYRLSTLRAAWKRVKANGGGAGTDHQSIEEFERNLEGNLEELSETLCNGSYRPRPIRRNYIAKAGGGQRPLGIPTVRDRVVQGALRLVVEPIFEREFIAGSYGFRPGKGCKDALREVEQLLKDGYGYVVDADLKSYFDTIPHDLLQEELRKQIADGRVMDLCEAFLKQDILEDLALWTPEEGTPQGAVISPLLANLYLHPVDVAVAAAGYRMIRYADDFVIMCRSRKEAEEALERVRELTQARGLSLHPEKTRLVAVADPGAGFDFLGYHFEAGTRWPRKKSLAKLKDSLRQKTRRSNGHSLATIIQEVNQTLIGWFGYFKHSRKWVFRRLDQWTRRRLRSILRERKHRGGISRGYDHIRWPNQFFQDLGLFSLDMAHQSLLQSLKR